jgi:c-di-GMP-binding flagellar brake protein YcgR
MSSDQPVRIDVERRRHPRFSVALPIEYWRIDKSRSRPGQTIDVSEDGLLIRVSESMEVGQVLGVTLFISSGPVLDALEAVAQVEVVWKDTNVGKDGGFRVGVKFVYISPKDTDKLKNFLNTLELELRQS